MSASPIAAVTTVSRPPAPAGEETYSRIAGLVERIRARDEEAESELYATLNRGIRFVLMRQIRPLADVDDRVHEIFMVALKAIREDRLRDPARLMGFIRSVVANHVATHIARTMRKREREVGADAAAVHLRDPRQSPEQLAIDGERLECAREMLQALCERDRTILIRFYVDGRSKEEIMAELDLTDTQFRLFKWRARARYDELLQRRLRVRTRNAATVTQGRRACGAVLRFSMEPTADM
ncbi:MAG TPA: sigma-70 family RNA polymerase sigma factor [Bryobacteraceae bacterium]|nr:sigma-70 family RNA polymerase sigma factor [Bryobacteraceae bacterium]